MRQATESNSFEYSVCRCLANLIWMRVAISKAKRPSLPFFAALSSLASIHPSNDRCRRNDRVPNLKYAPLCTQQRHSFIPGGDLNRPRAEEERRVVGVFWGTKRVATMMEMRDNRQRVRGQLRVLA